MGDNILLMYLYSAKVISVVDGDTVKLNVDLGFKTSIQITARMHGINAPEGNSDAKAYLKNRLPPGEEVCIQVMKSPGKYGRWIVKIFESNFSIFNTGVGTINQYLIDSGMAVVYK